MDQFLGQLQLVSFAFAPKGWALCNGQLLPVMQNQPLFSLLGVTFGGNGQTTFGLPDMRGRAAVSVGNGFALGSMQGTENVSLLLPQIPSHTHVMSVASTPGTLGPAQGNSFAGIGTANNFGSTASGLMDASAISSNGSGQPHENRSPFTVLNWIIALQGIFPSRS